MAPLQSLAESQPLPNQSHSVPRWLAQSYNRVFLFVISAGLFLGKETCTGYKCRPLSMVRGLLEGVVRPRGLGKAESCARWHLHVNNWNLLSYLFIQFSIYLYCCNEGGVISPPLTFICYNRLDLAVEDGCDPLTFLLICQLHIGNSLSMPPSLSSSRG